MKNIVLGAMICLAAGHGFAGTYDVIECKVTSLEDAGGEGSSQTIKVDVLRKRTIGVPTSTPGVSMYHGELHLGAFQKNTQRKLFLDAGLRYDIAERRDESGQVIDARQLVCLSVVPAWCSKDLCVRTTMSCGNQVPLNKDPFDPSSPWERAEVDPHFGAVFNLGGGASTARPILSDVDQAQLGFATVSCKVQGTVFESSDSK